MYRDEIFISQTNMALMEACWKVEQCVLCGSLTVNISICLPDFRSFLYGLVCSSNAFNHYALHNSIQIDMSSTQHNPPQELCTSPTSMHFSHQCGSWSTAALLSHQTKIPRQQWWGCLQIQPASPHWSLAVRKQKEIIIIKGWTVCRMCRDFPVPVPLQTLDIMSDEVSHYLKEDDATLQQGWLFSMEDRTTYHHATQQHNMHH